MTLTIGNWFVLILIFLIGALLAGLSWWAEENKKAVIFIGIFTLILLIGATIFFNWFNTSTASGIRHYKDFQSELSNGIEREIVITAEDGREIFRYEGKVDIESNHEDNYIKFESEEGKRYIIYYGIQDTIQIIEK